MYCDGAFFRLKNRKYIFGKLRREAGLKKKTKRED